MNDYDQRYNRFQPRAAWLTFHYCLRKKLSKSTEVASSVESVASVTEGDEPGDLQRIRMDSDVGGIASIKCAKIIASFL